MYCTFTIHSRAFSLEVLALAVQLGLQVSVLRGPAAEPEGGRSHMRDIQTLGERHQRGNRCRHISSSQTRLFRRLTLKGCTRPMQARIDILGATIKFSCHTNVSIVCACGPSEGEAINACSLNHINSVNSREGAPHHAMYLPHKVLGHRHFGHMCRHLL